MFFPSGDVALQLCVFHMLKSNSLDKIISRSGFEEHAVTTLVMGLEMSNL